MRADVAKVLIHMGHVLDRDFVAFRESRDSVAVKWLSAQPQPDDEAIDAAALELATVEQAKEAERRESDTARDESKRALSALDTIIGGIDAANLTQAKTAIKQVAQVLKHVIVAEVGR